MIYIVLISPIFCVPPGMWRITCFLGPYLRSCYLFPISSKYISLSASNTVVYLPACNLQHILGRLLHSCAVVCLFVWHNLLDTFRNYGDNPCWSLIITCQTALYFLLILNTLFLKLSDNLDQLVIHGQLRQIRSEGLHR